MDVVSSVMMNITLTFQTLVLRLIPDEATDSIRQYGTHQQMGIVLQYLTVLTPHHQCMFQIITIDELWLLRQLTWVY